MVIFLSLKKGWKSEKWLEATASVCTLLQRWAGANGPPRSARPWPHRSPTIRANEGICPPPLFFGKNGSNRVSSHAKRVQSCGKLKHALQNWQQFVIFTKSLKKGSKMWKWQGVSTQYQIGEKQPFSQPWRGGNSAKMTEKHTQVEFSILRCAFSVLAFSRHQIECDV